LQAYLKHDIALRPAKPVDPAPQPDTVDAPGLDRTAKMYVGGKQARPDGGYSQPVYSKRGTLLGHAGIGNRKDIRNAVEAARGAVAWSKSTGHLRAQILYYIAENLSARADEFASRIGNLTATSASKAKAEVSASVDRLFSYAAWADKFDGVAKSVPIRGVALAMREPVGVIGLLAPDDAPLLGAVSLLAPAIAMGNRVVLVPSAAAPLAATDLYQVLDTSDVPGGVVNIVTGDPAELGATLAYHLDVDALWSFSPRVDATGIEAASAGNLKRIWMNHGGNPDWASPAGGGRRFLDAATEVKTIWVPYGE
jgi:aldehyde dehydrogenase (NAD+)